MTITTNQSHKTGILLVNLGTPDSPAPKDVFRYLNEFLTDGRVIDIPWLPRQLLVRGIIVPFRYRQSARSYKEIWTDQGSPLKVYGFGLRDALQKLLGNDYCVELAMRYQNPSIESVLDKMLQQDLQRLIVVPLFPHYASATTGSVNQKIMEILSKKQVVPEVTFVKQFPTHPSLINAFATIGKTYDPASYDHVLFSFHGLPKKHVTKCDKNNHCFQKENCCNSFASHNDSCYSAQCHATAKAIAEALSLKEGTFSVSFQSRLGNDPWLEPFSSRVIEEFAKQGKKRVLVFCPAFVCDCLETVFEIEVENRLEFQKHGGETLTLVQGLNVHPVWVEGLKDIISDYLPARVS